MFGQATIEDGRRAERSALSRDRTPYRVLAALGAALAADLAFDPVHRHVPLCPFHAVTGAWCPLCGGLRVAYHLAHLQWSAAWRANLLVVLAVPVVVAYWLYWVRAAAQGRPRRRLGRSGWWVVAAIGVGFAVLRNLPGFAGLHP